MTSQDQADVSVVDEIYLRRAGKSIASALRHMAKGAGPAPILGAVDRARRDLDLALARAKGAAVRRQGEKWIAASVALEEALAAIDRASNALRPPGEKA